MYIRSLKQSQTKGRKKKNYYHFKLYNIKFAYIEKFYALFAYSRTGILQKSYIRQYNE